MSSEERPEFGLWRATLTHSTKRCNSGRVASATFGDKSINKKTVEVRTVSNANRRSLPFELLAEA